MYIYYFCKGVNLIRNEIDEKLFIYIKRMKYCIKATLKRRIFELIFILGRRLAMIKRSVYIA